MPADAGGNGGQVLAVGEHADGLDLKGRARGFGRAQENRLDLGIGLRDRTAESDGLNLVPAESGGHAPYAVGDGPQFLELGLFVIDQVRADVRAAGYVGADLQGVEHVRGVGGLGTGDVDDGEVVCGAAGEPAVNDAEIRDAGAGLPTESRVVAGLGERPEGLSFGLARVETSLNRVLVEDVDQSDHGDRIAASTTDGEEESRERQRVLLHVRLEAGGDRQSSASVR